MNGVTPPTLSQCICIFLIKIYNGLAPPTLYDASPVNTYISHPIILWFNTTNHL
jgi:hypothetical protein